MTLIHEGDDRYSVAFIGRPENRLMADFKDCLR